MLDHPHHELRQGHPQPASGPLGLRMKNAHGQFNEHVSPRLRQISNAVSVSWGDRTTPEDGWKVTHYSIQAYYREEHSCEPSVVRTSEDVDALIDDLATGPEFENLAVLHSSEREALPSGFPDHEFMVGADGRRQVGVLSFVAEKNFVSLGSSVSEGGTVTYFVSENPTEFPATAEIPLAVVRQAAQEFLSSGGQRPTCVQWQEPEVW
ncbi:Imm1 family immunity protein [Streptomyces sp. NPDC019539]|uniref:Imm1 family immunity protein n=1 Tax=Streptomyces sp. NPDC019539 TaxID=3365063 RepID=UPI00379609CD